MSATNQLESSLLGLIFQNAPCPNVGDAGGLRGSVAAGSFYLSLHTADPGEGGAGQHVSECTYAGYARQPVVRSAAAWSVAAGVASNLAVIAFPKATAGAETVTHFGIGSDATGPGNLFLIGTLTTPLAVSANITPSFSAGDLDVPLE